uniref:C2H2-type domain-containing protein n=1 Tax=Clastoptera arizonana TaxID=38151 RepID=A0A1B6DZA2_9HEMI
MEQSLSPVQHHCKDCGVFFDSGKSLDVHLQYHKENLLSKWATTSAEESNNNNNVKQHKLGPRVAQPDSSDSIDERFPSAFNFPVNQSLSFIQYSSNANSDLRQTSVDMHTHSVEIRPGADMRPPSADVRPQDIKPTGSNSPSTFSHNEDSLYILGSGGDFPHRRTNTPNSTSDILQNSQPTFRYHPYHSYSDRNNGISSSSSPHFHRSETPRQCDKCGFICDSQQSLLEHISSAHPPTPNVSFNFNNGFDNQIPEKVEPQAEILDLDSQEVHVYQPPEGQLNQNSQSSLSLPWLNTLSQDKKLFNHGQQINGNPMPSPDYNVTTTSMNSDLHPQTYQYDHHINPQLPLQHSITTSSQVPLSNHQMNKSSGPSKGGGSWKSNEARRPKTYNCTACNKWFTSSGHLKRHYNTTLHKNAVKQSGAPDPASLPISNHHHPPKEAMYPVQESTSPPSPMEEPPSIISQKLEDFERTQIQQQQLHFLGNHPNSLAGPSEISGGLLLPSTQAYQTPLQEEMRTIPSMQAQNFIPFPQAAIASYPQGTAIYPNFQPPRVTTPQTVTSITGNFDVQLLEHGDLHSIWARNSNISYEPLPSFTHNFGGILPTFAPFHTQIISTSNDNVGGLSTAQFEPLYSLTSPAGYSSDTMDTNNFSPKPQHNGSSESNSLDNNDTLILNTEDLVTTTSEVEIERKINLEDSSVTSTILDTCPPRQHRCDDCDKVFNKACYLTQHNKTFHNGEKPHKCEKCGKRFEIQSLLVEHKGKHAGEKPYKCEICPKQFNHKTDLRRHMCLHSGDKPYACSYCGKGFIRKDHMVKHLDTHKRKQSVTRHLTVQHKIIEEEQLMLPVPVVQVMH